MFGYRARIGYISPSVIELNAYDFYRIMLTGTRWLKSKAARRS
jgi:hypothetical protein